VSNVTENISYIYSATGTKLAMLKGTTVVNFYAGTCVYKGNKTLDYLLHPEGVVRATGQGLSYEYFLKDHLGNTRVVFGSDGAVLQTTDYYPFGMSHTPKAKENENRYLYNGKEQQDALISGVKFDWYDYGARMYDAAIGRWHVVDPLAEDFAGISPYVYVANNPIILVDPDGQAWKPTMDENNGKPTGYEWIPEGQSYNEDGSLKTGLYAQAIFFSHNGTFDSESDYNMGSATANVYKADGTTETFDATTYPSDQDDYATVPEGKYEAKVGLHNGSYTALRMGDVGTTNFSDNRIELGKENPAYSDGRTYASGINIHKAGLNNKTGMTTSGSPISAGCSLIDRNNWGSFIGNFNTDAQKGNTVSVSISRTYATPSNQNVPLFVRPLVAPADATRVALPILRR